MGLGGLFDYSVSPGPFFWEFDTEFWAPEFRPGSRPWTGHWTLTRTLTRTLTWTWDRTWSLTIVCLIFNKILSTLYWPNIVCLEIKHTILLSKNISFKNIWRKSTFEAQLSKKNYLLEAKVQTFRHLLLETKCIRKDTWYKK